MDHKKLLIDRMRGFPSQPGVYLFKNSEGEVVYIGKAKDLKRRAAQYIQSAGSDVKTDTIFESSVTVECMITETELEALLLEAKLIQHHQPRCNVLLKTGQPFLYLFVPTNAELPELMMVRNQKQKGTYFGPFLEKTSARKVFEFLVKTFRLKRCNKRIENGCLNFHMGLCAGTCRSDFDRSAYVERLELAKQSLRQGHKKFLEYLQELIQESNKSLSFERSKELHDYFQAFQRVFYALDHQPADLNSIVTKQVWILSEDQTSLWVFSERDGVIKKKRVFCIPPDTIVDSELLGEYFLSFYRVYEAPSTILLNVDLGDEVKNYELFCKEWHHTSYPITILQPTQGHFAHVVRLAQVHVQQEIAKQVSLGHQLKQLLKLSFQPRSIDCFDISHKQGTFMVGSCVRFVDGKPDPSHFRRFHIKTVDQIDDYACLREVVGRRYKDASQLPDLIMIDGGKGQLNAVADLFPHAEFFSLAKREETVFSKHIPEGKKLDEKSYSGQVLIALRDYAHHFAISFHRSLETLDQ